MPISYSPGLCELFIFGGYSPFSLIDDLKIFYPFIWIGDCSFTLKDVMTIFLPRVQKFLLLPNGEDPSQESTEAARVSVPWSSHVIHIFIMFPQQEAGLTLLFSACASEFMAVLKTSLVPLLWKSGREAESTSL